MKALLHEIVSAQIETAIRLSERFLGDEDTASKLRLCRRAVEAIKHDSITDEELMDLARIGVVMPDVESPYIMSHYERMKEMMK